MRRFLVCHPLIWTCLRGSGFFAKVSRVPRVSWNSSHVAVLPNSGKQMHPLLRIPGKREIKDFFFNARAVGSFFLSSSQGACVLFKKMYYCA